MHLFVKHHKLTEYRRVHFTIIIAESRNDLNMVQHLILTECEEQELVDWAVEMGRIGYGRTREQMSMMV